MNSFEDPGAVVPHAGGICEGGAGKTVRSTLIQSILDKWRGINEFKEKENDSFKEWLCGTR